MEMVSPYNRQGADMLCNKCVLPESKPYIRLDSDGVCNICREYEKTASYNNGTRLLETDLIKILNRHKNKGEYDCLVMCSGGKDSTSALYYMKRRYRLEPLAFTFDHGFETEDAKANIKNAVEILGVDLLSFKTNFMNRIFSEVIRTKSRAVICHLCSLWYMDLAFKTAARFNIPVIIAGWTKGQSVKEQLVSGCRYNRYQPEFISMAEATSDFLDGYIKSNPEYKGFPRSMEEVLRRAKARHNSIVLSPHWFLPFDSQSYTETIKKDLKWKPSGTSYPLNPTNCHLNFVSVLLSMKYYGYTHYHVEISKMIRMGILTREEALDMLKVNFDQNLLESVLNKLDCRPENLTV
jgi:hypothetical protein